MAEQLLPARGKAAIRMYGQGFGDCFLLAFPAEDRAGDPVYVVIDCGVIKPTPDEDERMRAVVRDLHAATNGRIDLLVITHEHWDHVSGFTQARDEWDKFRDGSGNRTIREVWTAWTEDPGNRLGQAIHEHYEIHAKALQDAAAAARRLERERKKRKSRGGASPLARVRGLMGFLGIDDEETEDGAAGVVLQKPAEKPGFSVATDEAMQYAKGLGKCRHCYPGEVWKVPGTGVRAFVLGPPEDQAALRDTNPEGDEEYRKLGAAGLAAALEGLNAFSAAFLRPADGEGGARERSLAEQYLPFDRSTQIPLTRAANLPFFQERYGFDAAPEDANNAEWRRIDDDWLSSAGYLGLQMDTLTNNTSLVLAFELPNQKVLLFVGDAQAGNWLSWDSLKKLPGWTPCGGATAPAGPPDIDDLLARTVFYKVGHHGSHNATLRASGVSRMATRSRDLIAFVPVNPTVAQKIKGWKHIPLPSIIEDLMERTGKRVVMNDDKVPDGFLGGGLTRCKKRLEEATVTRKKPKPGQDAEIKVEGVPLWVQVEVDVG